jgi:hypothetical protein
MLPETTGRFEELESNALLEPTSILTSFLAAGKLQFLAL